MFCVQWICFYQHVYIYISAPPHSQPHPPAKRLSFSKSKQQTNKKYIQILHPWAVKASSSIGIVCLFLILPPVQQMKASIGKILFVHWNDLGNALLALRSPSQNTWTFFSKYMNIFSQNTWIFFSKYINIFPDVLSDAAHISRVSRICCENNLKPASAVLGGMTKVGSPTHPLSPYFSGAVFYSLLVLTEK